MMQTKIQEVLQDKLSLAIENYILRKLKKCSRNLIKLYKGQLMRILITKSISQIKRWLKYQKKGKLNLKLEILVVLLLLAIVTIKS